MSTQRIFICIYTLLFLTFFTDPVYSEELPEPTKPPPIKSELLRSPVPEGFALVKGGCFPMGDAFGDGGSDEKPVHEVCVDDFYIGKYEVTQKEWQDVMGDNPSYFKGCDNCPVEGVSWEDVKEYISRLNQKSLANSPFSKGGQWGFFCAWF